MSLLCVQELLLMVQITAFLGHLVADALIYILLLNQFGMLLMVQVLMLILLLMLNVFVNIIRLHRIAVLGSR